jgi:hypothetical protein
VLIEYIGKAMSGVFLLNVAKKKDTEMRKYIKTILFKQ